MAIEIKAPTFPESVADGTVATWHKKPGEAVKRDELIVDIETDKVVIEVLAEADGVLAEIIKNEGDTVLSNELLGKLTEGGAAAAMGNVNSNDNWQVHYRDTTRGGKFMNNYRMAELHAKEAPDRVWELEEWGALFDRTKDGKIELEEALRKADSRDGLALKIRLSEGSTGEHDPYADMYGTT